MYRVLGDILRYKESNERLINIDQRDRLRDIETRVGRGSEVKRH